MISTEGISRVSADCSITVLRRTKGRPQNGQMKMGLSESGGIGSGASPGELPAYRAAIRRHKVSNSKIAGEIIDKVVRVKG